MATTDLETHSLLERLQRIAELTPADWALAYADLHAHIRGASADPYAWLADIERRIARLRVPVGAAAVAPARARPQRFALWLRTKLKERDVRERDLARLTEMPLETVKSWCNGQTLPTMRMCEQLATLFGLTAAEVRAVAGMQSLSGR